MFTSKILALTLLFAALLAERTLGLEPLRLLYTVR